MGHLANFDVRLGEGAGLGPKLSVSAISVLESEKLSPYGSFSTSWVMLGYQVQYGT